LRLRVFAVKNVMMEKNPNILIVISFLLFTSSLYSQDWQFIKEKEGIKIYTRKEPGSNLKSFRGEALLHAKYEDILNLVGNVKNQDWWDKGVSELKILLFDEGKHVQYYIVYDSPWPVSDRDLVVDAVINTDPVTKIRTVKAKPLPNVVPEKPGRVRIKNYWQSWTITPIQPGLVHVELEGFVDPGGSVPDWLYNMVITDTPLKVIRTVKTKVHAQ
jgi:hypothetical protein